MTWACGVPPSLADIGDPPLAGTQLRSGDHRGDGIEQMRLGPLGSPAAAAVASSAPAM